MDDQRGVTNEEVLKYASPKCNCGGSGEIKKWVQVDPNTMHRIATVCGCAMRRFLKKNRERITMQADGGMLWKNDTEVTPVLVP